MGGYSIATVIVIETGGASKRSNENSSSIDDDMVGSHKTNGALKLGHDYDEVILYLTNTNEDIIHWILDQKQSPQR